MKVVILGAGIIGVSTAWHLLERGHEVVVVDRQADAALETSFANAGQISVSYCEPWANREAPLKALKWMFSKEAPLLFRPTLDPAQWAWGLRFLAQCNDAAFERNVRQLVALGAYSHAALKDVVRATGIEYQRLERGIAHYYTDAHAFDGFDRDGVLEFSQSRGELTSSTDSRAGTLCDSRSLSRSRFGRCNSFSSGVHIFFLEKSSVSVLSLIFSIRTECHFDYL